MPRERALGGGSRLCRLCRFLEHEEELVAAMVDDVPAGGLDRGAQEAAVVVEELGVAVPEPLHELGRAFDVCEDQRDGSMGKIWHVSLLQRDLRPNMGSRAGRTVDVELST